VAAPPIWCLLVIAKLVGKARPPVAVLQGIFDIAQEPTALPLWLAFGQVLRDLVLGRLRAVDHADLL
jgi:hypothetical protein